MNISINGFVVKHDKQYKHITIMFPSDYDRDKKDNKINILARLEEYEKKLEDPIIPISKCKRFLKIKYNNYCKCYDPNPTTIDKMFEHNVKISGKINQYKFYDKKGQFISGVNIYANKIQIIKK